ncbi:phage major tail tube protein [Ancylobacter sp. TS-1]|uniref:phage major tail tube protein n=1 Tax=Ancylobacter sp. TS-1 TaxID=1850374 RepID=UPI001265C367|nr:phage major tail tube protein [Ancylobacter sp. TS-1]QFR32372.1 hypothetical protein GBB76_04160 [Ancylobacter sp. TS-1]
MKFVRKAGNLYVEGSNQWMGLKDYQLPTPRVKKETHSPGGGIMDVEIPIGAIEPLTFAFNTINAEPEVLGSFGMHLSQRRLFTVYELLQDEDEGTKRERIITMRGVLSETTPEQMAGRGVKGYGYQISSILDYEDVIEGYGIVARFTFKTNTWRGYGVAAGSDEDNRILRISASA